MVDTDGDVAPHVRGVGVEVPPLLTGPALPVTDEAAHGYAHGRFGH